ncbi:MAG: T9SS type A sorting domain-containing protein [Flavobacteriales bacterium]|nr:T9SS type A sorting domain-containing protein [Flavobacteriales bacterium]
MKKFLLSFIVIFAFGFANSQIYTANDTTAFAEFTSVDADGDGFDWTLADLSGSGLTLEAQGECILSNSWAGVPLTPDNWLVSPAIDLSGQTGDIFFSYRMGSVESTASGWYEEFLSVYLVDDVSIPALQAATPIRELTLPGGEEMFTYSEDISSSAGESAVYLVFRHHNCTDENFVVLDDITVADVPTGIVENQLETNMFPNPVVDVLNITTASNMVDVSIYGVDGKLISNEAVNNVIAQINVSDLNAGMYIAVIEADNGLMSRQSFVKK